MLEHKRMFGLFGLIFKYVIKPVILFLSQILGKTAIFVELGVENNEQASANPKAEVIISPNWFVPVYAFFSRPVTCNVM